MIKQRPGATGGIVQELVTDDSRLAAAAKRLLLAQRDLDNHPANDTTKVWSRKLDEVGYARDELRAALTELTGVDVIAEADAEDETYG